MIESKYSGGSVILSSNTKRNHLSEVVVRAMCKGYERSKILYYFAFETDNKLICNGRINITNFGELIETFLSEWAGTCATIIPTHTCDFVWCYQTITIQALVIKNHTVINIGWIGVLIVEGYVTIVITRIVAANNGPAIAANIVRCSYPWRN